MPLVVTTTDVMFKNFFGFDGLTIGLGAGKFWEVLRIFARIFPNLSEKKLHEKVTSKKKLYVILGAISAPYFQRFCQDFHGFFADFIGFCPDFTESKCLGVLLHPLPPTPVGLTNVMLKWILCGCEGTYDDFYLFDVAILEMLTSFARL